MLKKKLDFQIHLVVGLGPHPVPVFFPVLAHEYQALSVLRRADAEERIGVLGAAVVERGADGKIRVPEGSDNVIGAGLAGGSLIGMLVGEYAVEVINDEMSGLGGTVVRRFAAEVLAELEASEQATKAATSG